MTTREPEPRPALDTGRAPCFTTAAMNDTTHFAGDVRSSVWAFHARKVEAIRRAAAKLGTHFECTVSAPFGKVITANGVDTVREFVTVSITADVPVISGWTFAAAIDHTTEGNLLRTSPRFNGALPVSYRTDRATCDHCGCARNRNTTFALNRGDEWRRVGSSCLVDFLGHGDAVALVEFAASVADLANTFGAPVGDDGDENEAGGSGRTYYVTRAWVALAFRTIAIVGAYVSGRAAREGELSGRYVESTAARMLRHLHPGRNTYVQDRLPEISDEQAAGYLADADAALAWVATEVAAKPERSDFEHNLCVIARTEAITSRHTGIAAYIPEAYRRHLGVVAERRAREASGAASEWLGAEGDKVEFDFVLSGVRTSESQFGMTFWFSGTSGANRVTIKGSNEYFSGVKRGEGVDPVVGQTYRVKAAVKRTEVFRGEKATTVTRARVSAV